MSSSKLSYSIKLELQKELRVETLSQSKTHMLKDTPIQKTNPTARMTTVGSTSFIHMEQHSMFKALPFQFSVLGQSLIPLIDHSLDVAILNKKEAKSVQLVQSNSLKMISLIKKIIRKSVMCSSNGFSVKSQLRLINMVLMIKLMNIIMFQISHQWQTD
jgi:hypothetical protein